MDADPRIGATEICFMARRKRMTPDGRLDSAINRFLT